MNHGFKKIVLKIQPQQANELENERQYILKKECVLVEYVNKCELVFKGKLHFKFIKLPFFREDDQEYH